MFSNRGINPGVFRGLLATHTHLIEDLPCHVTAPVSDGRVLKESERCLSLS